MFYSYLSFLFLLFKERISMSECCGSCCESRPVVTSQNAPGTNDVQIDVIDNKGDGGAYHRYRVVTGDVTQFIQFQKGPKENKLNGLTIEALLAICQHRLECFQAGNFACDVNALALRGINDALQALHARMIARDKTCS